MICFVELFLISLNTKVIVSCLISKPNRAGDFYDRYVIFSCEGRPGRTQSGRKTRPLSSASTRARTVSGRFAPDHLIGVQRHFKSGLVNFLKDALGELAVRWFLRSGLQAINESDMRLVPDVECLLTFVDPFYKHKTLDACRRPLTDKPCSIDRASCRPEACPEVHQPTPFSFAARGEFFILTKSRLKATRTALLRSAPSAPVEPC